MQSAHAALCCHRWPVWLSVPYFQQYHTKDKVFEKKILKMKYVYVKILNSFPEIFLFLQSIQLETIITVYRSSSYFKESWNFSADFRKYSNIKLHEKYYSGRPVAAYGRTDGLTDRQSEGLDEANTVFSQFYKNTWNSTFPRQDLFSSSGYTFYWDAVVMTKLWHWLFRTVTQTGSKVKSTTITRNQNNKSTQKCSFYQTLVTLCCWMTLWRRQDFEEGKKIFIMWPN
jgi:hypothetical protein